MKDALTRDRRISGGLLFLSSVFLAIELSRWIGTLHTPGVWSIAAIFHWGSTIFRHNLSIVLSVYVFLCMQMAGWIELRYKSSYLSAFLLTFLLTPLVYLPLFLILRKGKTT
ncbi:MAG: hypothetical protein ACE5D1_02020 [Fidelibacterota bacterium]